MDTNGIAFLIDTVLSTSGIGERVVSDLGTNTYIIAQQLDTCSYLTYLRREKLKAAFKLQLIASSNTVVHSPADIFELVRDLEIEPQEHLVVLVLDRRNNLLKRVNLYLGTQSSCSSIRLAEILRPAIIYNGSAIIVVHNHPSGDPTPSPDDVALTRAIFQGCKLMDIDFLDHVVVGHGRYVSHKERGLGFS